MQRAESEASAKVAREVLGLLMAFAVREGVIASNPVATVKRFEEPKRSGATTCDRTLKLYNLCILGR